MAAHDRVGVVERDRRGVGVAAVEEELHRCPPSARELAREGGGDHERPSDVAPRQPVRRLGLARDPRLHGEVATRDQRLDERAALLAAVTVEHGEGDVVHVPGDRVAEEEQQEERQHECQDHAPGIPPELDPLLARERARAHRIDHPSTAPPAARTSATKTS